MHRTIRVADAILIALAAAVVIAAVPVSAQWVSYRDSAVPRMQDGKPNLSAPAPRAPDGRPDLSGVWMHELTPASEIRRLFGHDEQDIQFPAPIPVHLTYQTATVEDDGQLIIRPDVYGLDSRVLGLIKTERGMIDPVSKEHDRDAANAAAASARRPIRQQVPLPTPVGGFFQALFGGPPPPVPRPPSRIR